MSALFSQALAAARTAAAAQHYPQGALYVVATPIGNLADISLRALHVLELADAVACEDTRHTQALLRAYGIDKTAGQLLAVHQHNEAEAAQAVIERLRAGARIAYASDAGTPAVSDPGARLVAAVRAAGLVVVPVPGVSSITAVLSVAGAVEDAGRFVFMGFLPAKAGERETGGGPAGAGDATGGAAGGAAPYRAARPGARRAWRPTCDCGPRAHEAIRASGHHALCRAAGMDCRRRPA